MDAGSATPTQTILWLVASPLLIAAVGTLFVATVILVSFTVPNPQPIETQYITGPITPGGGGGGGPIVPQPVEPASGDLMTDIEQAASAACVPTGLVAAVMQTESGAYGWSDSEYQRFSTPGWWLDADDGSGNSINCYQSHYGPENSPQDNECRAGYCYDTCTTTGACGKKYACNANNQCNQVIPSLPCATDGQCSEHDVMGATQFERKTFYSNPTNPGQSQNCWARDGSGNNCYSTAGNRCNAFDIVRATANKLAADGGANCTQPVWDLGQICVAARKYCGSCGQVETFDEATLSDSATYPCKNWYLKPGDNAYGDPLGACTATHPDTGALEGYCDKIVRIYTGS
jgi:hypothetical protein